jgi:hypothetical protein
MKKLAQRFTGVVYIDGELFTHPNRLMGTADSTRNKVVKQLRENVRETLTSHYISQHTIELHVCDRQTKQVETIKY